jgi:hypothetical protein
VIGVAVLLTTCTLAAIALVTVVLFSFRRSAIEQVFDDANAEGEWPNPDELLDAFSSDVDGRSEAELNRLAGQLSDLNRRLDQMKRQTREGERR